jgi:hypothetical protein
MTLTESLVERVKWLPADQQLKVLNFVDSIQSGKETAATPRRSPEGILAGMVPDLTLDDFKEARREMWRGVPRDFPE